MNKVAVDSDLVYGKLKLHEANQLLGLEEEYTLHQTDHCIGRNPEDANGEPQFVINTPYISGTHCRLYVANPDQSQTPGAEADLSVFLEDLSSNGTHINGKAVGKRKTIQLNNEDVIQLYKPRAKRGSKGAAPQAIVYQFFAFPEGLTSKAQAKRRQKLSAKRASPGKRKAASGMKPPPPKRAAVSERQQATKPGADAQLLRKMESKVKEEKEKSAKAEEKNTKLEKKIAALEKQVLRMEMMAAELATANEMAEEMRSSLQKMKNEAQVVSQEGGDKSKVIAALRADKEDLDQRLNDTNQRLAKERKEKVTLQAELRSEKSSSKSLQNRVEAAQESETKANERINDLETQIRKAQQKAKELDSLVATQNEEIERARQNEIELEEMRANSDIIKSDLETKRAECKRLDALHNDLAEDLQKERSAAAVIREECESLTEQNEKLKAAVSKSQEEIEALKGEKKNLEKELQSKEGILEDQAAAIKSKDSDIALHLKALKMSKAKTVKLDSNVSTLQQHIKAIEEWMEAKWKKEEEDRKELRQKFVVDLVEVEVEEDKIQGSEDEMTLTPTNIARRATVLGDKDEASFLMTQDPDERQAPDFDEEKAKRTPDLDLTQDDQNIDMEDTECNFQGPLFAKDKQPKEEERKDQNEDDRDLSQPSTQSDEDMRSKGKQLETKDLKSPVKASKLKKDNSCASPAAEDSEKEYEQSKIITPLKHSKEEKNYMAISPDGSFKGDKSIVDDPIDPWGDVTTDIKDNGNDNKEQVIADSFEAGNGDKNQENDDDSFTLPSVRRGGFHNWFDSEAVDSP